ncbi:hypothetical protein [Phenylobacterium sp.]|jgi:hypothetical protein|uniref:hypothetical protein n=1 Tax=Phenylobacterium sp. TaxID=1871053 RepID=UPI002F93BB22
MSGAHDEPQSWADDDGGDAALANLRRQLETVKRRMEEHRLQLHAAGLRPEDPGENAEA